MTNLQENRLSMYLALRDFQSSYTAITNPLPNYTSNLTAFVNTIVQIQAVSQQQNTSKKGVTDNKTNLKETVIVTAADYARKLSTFARFNNNPVLQEEVDFSESKLRQIPDTTVKDFAQIAYDKAQSNISLLAPYGITAATQTAFAAAITAYNASIGKPKVSRTEIHQITQQLETLFETADAALENMDAAVEIVRLTQKNFYTGYKNARKIDDLGAGSLAVIGLITDAHSGEPVVGAMLQFALANNETALNTGNETHGIVKKSAKKGGFKIKSIPQGIYHVTVQKVGYAEHKTTVAVAEGELTELHFQLSKN